MSAASLVSVQEYLATVYHPDCEYLDGEIVERNRGETDHGTLQSLIIGWFLQRRKALGVQVITEGRVQISRTRFRIPDVTVVLGRVKQRVLRDPPFLCIEILSPEDRASRIEPRIDEYLSFGVAHVWLIDPRERKAWSYTPDGRRQMTNILSTTNPDIALPLDDIFAELDEMIDFSDE